jgi:hypothetical protein
VEADEIAKRRRQRMIRIAITAAYHAILLSGRGFPSIFPRPDARVRGERAMKRRIKTMQNCLVVFDLHQTRARWRA